MPDTFNLTDALRRLLVATVAYAVAVALVAGCLLPTFLSADPVARLVPKASTAVARSPQVAPHPFARTTL